MGFFDFLDGTERYAGKAKTGIHRLNIRHRFLIEAFTEDLTDARVLDLAAHDGRWSYALSSAGAREVVSVEARRELIDQFGEYPHDEAAARVRFIEGDIFTELDRMVAAGESFDVVAVFGIFYHVMDHYRLLKAVRALEPKLVIIDSEFVQAKRAVIDVVSEDPSKFLNTIAHLEGQTSTPKGIPSFSAMELMATSLGWSTSWADWESVRRRRWLKSYFRGPESRNLRATCSLRPVD